MNFIFKNPNVGPLRFKFVCSLFFLKLNLDKKRGKILFIYLFMIRWGK